MNPAPMPYHGGMSIRGLLLLLAFVSLLPPSAGAQETPPSAVFTDTVDVEVVNIDVLVTDRRGYPISGLGLETFSVLEDGEAVEITNLIEVKEGRVAPRKEEAASAAKVSSPELPTERVNVAVYVDLTSLRRAGLRRTVREVEQFFERRWTQGNRAMLAVCSGMLRVPVPFTDDPQDVIAGLEALRNVAGHREFADADRMMLEEMRVDALDEESEVAEMMEAMIDFREMAANEQEKMQAQRSMQSLRALVDQLALGPRGRRVILMVSDGIPPLWTRRHLDQLIDHANANRVSVYTLFSGGDPSYTAPVLSAEVRGTVGHSDIWGHRTRAFQRAEDSLDTVGLMAWRTGGRVLFSVNDSTLSQLANDFSSYYSIGYRSNSPGDGRAHAIEVKVDNKRAQVRHRLGYRSFERRDRLAGAAVAALAAANPDNSLGVSWTITGPASAGEGGLVVPIRVELPSEQLVLVPDGDRLRGGVRLYLAGRYASGSKLTLQEVLLPIDLSAEQAATAPNLVHRGSIVLPVGRATIAVTAVDETADTVSSQPRHVLVGADGNVEEVDTPFG